MANGQQAAAAAAQQQQPTAAPEMLPAITGLPVAPPVPVELTTLQKLAERVIDFAGMQGSPGAIVFAVCDGNIVVEKALHRPGPAKPAIWRIWHVPSLIKDKVDQFFERCNPNAPYRGDELGVERCE